MGKIKPEEKYRRLRIKQGVLRDLEKRLLSLQKGNLESRLGMYGSDPVDWEYLGADIKDLVGKTMELYKHAYENAEGLLKEVDRMLENSTQNLSKTESAISGTQVFVGESLPKPVGEGVSNPVIDEEAAARVIARLKADSEKPKSYQDPPYMGNPNANGRAEPVPVQPERIDGRKDPVLRKKRSDKAKTAWANLSPEEKAERVAKMKAGRAKARESRL